MKIIYLNKVRIYFSRLIPKWHDLGYFCFAETAKQYIDEIFTEIEIQISIQKTQTHAEIF